MVAKRMDETCEQAIQALIAPDLERSKGQLTGRDARMSTLDKRADEGLGALRQEMRAGVRSRDDHSDALKEGVGGTNGRLDESIDIRERRATLEATLALRA